MPNDDFVMTYDFLETLYADVMSMQVTEDIHMIFDHLIMSIFYKTLCGKDHLTV